MSDHLLDLTISELASLYPASLDLLAAHGIGIFADPATMSSFGPALKLRTLLKAKQVDAAIFLTALTEQDSGRRVAAEAISSPGINLLALLPCPLKVPLEEAFLSFMETLPAEERAAFSYCIEGNANLQLDYADFARHFETLEEMPDIVITPGFNTFFYRPFVERFIASGDFTSVNHYDGAPDLAHLQVVDPERHYTMLAMNLLVPVVDEARLAGRPSPRSWRDLLDPIYADSLAIRGNRDGTFCETLLLTILKDFGPSGVEQLGRNVKYGWHPSQMVKAAGSGRADAPAISVMPLFFAKNLRHRPGVQIVWPEDGALVSPVSMLVKTAKREALRHIISFLTGPVTARICAGAFFPALHPEVENGVPQGASFKWIGWDYVKAEDLEARTAEANELFQRARQRDGL